MCRLPKGAAGSWSLRLPRVGCPERQAPGCLGLPSLFHLKDRRGSNASAKTQDLVFLLKTCVACSKNGRDAESVSRLHQWKLHGEPGKRGTRFLKMSTGTVSP